MREKLIKNQKMCQLLKKIFKNPLIGKLLIIILLATFFYAFRLNQTFVMAGDTARDLIRVIEIWQKKEFTIIGPPVNTISNNPIQVYFGSLHYYLGLLGLLLANFNPIGSVYPNILLAVISIPFFFSLAKKLLKEDKLALGATFIYALSPLTVALTRSYWNPNLIIPLSVFFWFCLLCKKSPKYYFAGGVISGIIFNLHYMNVIPIAIYLIILLFRKREKYIFFTLAGFTLSILPFIAFELKNNFFLVKALLGTMGGFSNFGNRSLNPFLSIDAFAYLFGLAPSQYFIPGLFDFPFNYRIVGNSVIGTIVLFILIKKKISLNWELAGVFLGSLLMAWYFQQWQIIGVRYIFSFYPLLIIFFIAFMTLFKNYLMLFLFIPMLLLSGQIITHKLDYQSKSDYLPIKTIETISKAIISDNPKGKYNVTENILGDAQALAFRYFLLKDAKVKPQPIENYDQIDTLYLVTPSLDKTRQENRWEFNASGPKKIIWEKDFDELKLYKLVR